MFQIPEQRDGDSISFYFEQNPEAVSHLEEDEMQRERKGGSRVNLRDILLAMYICT